MSQPRGIRLAHQPSSPVPSHRARKKKNINIIPYQNTITLAGELDMADEQTLLKLRCLSASLPRALTLDLTKLTFMDVAGTRALHHVYQTLRLQHDIILLPPLHHSALTVAQLLYPGWLTSSSAN